MSDDDPNDPVDPRLDAALDVFVSDVMTTAQDIEFGTHPGDSAALCKLREAIDDHLPWPSEQAERDGDYEAAVLFAAFRIKQLDAHWQTELDRANTLERQMQAASDAIEVLIREAQKARAEAEEAWRAVAELKKGPTDGRMSARGRTSA